MQEFIFNLIIKTPSYSSGFFVNIKIIVKGQNKAKNKATITSMGAITLAETGTSSRAFSSDISITVFPSSHLIIKTKNIEITTPTIQI